MGKSGYTALGTVGRSLDVWGRNLGPALILGGLFFSPVIIYTVVLSADVADAGMMTSDDVWTWLLATAGLAYGADQLLAAPIVYGVVQELNGTHAGVGSSVAQGLRASSRCC